MNVAVARSGASTRVNEFLANYLSTMVLICFTVVFYSEFSSYHLKIFNSNWRPNIGGFVFPVLIRTRDVLLWVAAVYAVVLVPYYWYQPGMRSKAAIVAEYVFSARSFADLRRPLFEEQQAMLATLLKFLFIPFCLNGLLGHAAVVNSHVIGMIDLYVHWKNGAQFDYVVIYSTRLHRMLLSLIFVFDFLPFVLGYLVQHRVLKNEIKTVDPSLLGWVVCLLCYPPFNGAWGQFFSWGTKHYADMLNGWPAWMHIGVNLTLVVLFGLYASASVSLGLKCSNLTNRGTVDRGLYSVIRHPAYALKNLAWWVAGIPVFYTLFSKSLVSGLWGVFCLGGWSALYVMRAWTEERHLLRFDPAYKAYCERVRYRFIPGVL